MLPIGNIEQVDDPGQDRRAKGITMARRRLCFEESATYEVYSCYKQHVIQTDTLPNPHVFWEKILVPQLGYAMPWGSFQYHWMQLQIRCLVKVDELTRAVSLPELDVVEKFPST